MRASAAVHSAAGETMPPSTSIHLYWRGGLPDGGFRPVPAHLRKVLLSLPAQASALDETLRFNVHSDRTAHLLVDQVVLDPKSGIAEPAMAPAVWPASPEALFERHRGDLTMTMMSWAHDIAIRQFLHPSLPCDYFRWAAVLGDLKTDVRTKSYYFDFDVAESVRRVDDPTDGMAAKRVRLRTITSHPLSDGLHAFENDAFGATGELGRDAVERICQEMFNRLVIACLPSVYDQGKVRDALTGLVASTGAEALDRTLRDFILQRSVALDKRLLPDDLQAQRRAMLQEGRKPPALSHQTLATQMRALRERYGDKSEFQLRRELGSAAYDRLMQEDFRMTMWLTVDVFFDLVPEFGASPDDEPADEHTLYGQVFGVDPNRVIVGAKDGSWTLGETHRAHADL